MRKRKRRVARRRTRRGRKTRNTMKKNRGMRIGYRM